MHLYIHTYPYISIHIHTYAYMRIPIYEYINAYTSIYIYICTLSQKDTSPAKWSIKFYDVFEEDWVTDELVAGATCAQVVYIYIYIYICIYIHVH